ncbi:hypothetical protein HHI36_010509, partial [Cryptolaemus montrouzieri]
FCDICRAVVLEKLSSKLLSSPDYNEIILEKDVDEVKEKKVSLLAVKDLIQKSVKYPYQMILIDNIAMEKQYHDI